LVENIAPETLRGIVKGQNAIALAAFNILDRDDAAELDALIVDSNLVHLDFAFINFVRDVHMNTASRRFFCPTKIVSPPKSCNLSMVPGSDTCTSELGITLETGEMSVAAK